MSPESGKKLNKKIKNFNAHLIKNGWDSSVEIKAANLWHAPKNGNISAGYKYKNKAHEPIEFALSEIAAMDCYIEYIAVRLDGVAEGYKKVGTAELYKIYSWELLRSSLCRHPAIHLFVDRRDRHRDAQLKFDGFLEAKYGGTGREGPASARPDNIALSLGGREWVKG